jgi:hypothetical protein
VWAPIDEISIEHDRFNLTHSPTRCRGANDVPRRGVYFPDA